MDFVEPSSRTSSRSAYLSLVLVVALLPVLVIASRTKQLTNAAASNEPTPIPIPSTIEVYAAGTPIKNIYPSIRLSVNDITVENWTNVEGDAPNNQFVKFSYTSPTPLKTGTNIKVSLVSDINLPGFGDRNVRIDKIVVDGMTYETEASSVFSRGGKDTDGTCGQGYLHTDWLLCNGYFSYTLQ